MSVFKTTKLLIPLLIEQESGKLCGSSPSMIFGIVAPTEDLIQRD